jgi:metal-responsive CopG/Arc/MetJ family transcriptional regulator
MKTVTIRLPEELIKEIEKTQLKNQRTKSKTFEILLREGLEKESAK